MKYISPDHNCIKLLLHVLTSNEFNLHFKFLSLVPSGTDLAPEIISRKPLNSHGKVLSLVTTFVRMLSYKPLKDLTSIPARAC